MPPSTPTADRLEATLGAGVTAGPDAGAGELPIPTHIGRYEVVRELGVGGFGVVYEARDPALARRVAIKVLRPDRRAGAIVRERLRLEARSLAQLTHPNIVNVFDIGEDEQTGDFHLVLEYVEGEDLASWLIAVRDPSRILDVFAGAARGLAAAHRAGIVHRDFKPANVLVTRAGVPKVADFGLAIVAATAQSRTPEGAGVEVPEVDVRLTGRSEVLGTPYYMAPEQHRGLDLDGRADQYAWCLALARGLLGYDPLGAVGVVDLLRAKHSGPWRRTHVEGVDDRVWDLIERGLAVSPADRFESMDELLVALGRARRKRAKLLGYVTTIAAVAAVAVAGAWSDPQCDRVHAFTPWTAEQRARWVARTDVDPAWAAHFVQDMDEYATAATAAAEVVCGTTDHEPWHATGAACLLALQAEVASVHADVETLPPEYGPYYEVTQSLTTPTLCADPTTAAAVVERMRAFDGSRRTQILGMAFVRRGELERARALAKQLVEDGEHLGEAWHQLGAIALAEGDFEAAYRWLEAAYFVAVEQQNAVDAGWSAALLMGTAAGMGRDDLVEDWTRHARAALERSGGHPRVAAMVDEHQGLHAFWRGDYQAALEHQSRAFAVLADIYGADEQPLEIVRNNLALTLEQLGRLDEALDHHQELYAARVRRGGLQHVDVYYSAVNVANLLYRLGDLDGSIEHARIALEAARTFGPSGVAVASAALTLAQAELVAYGDSDVTPEYGDESGLEHELLRQAIDMQRAYRMRRRGQLAEAARLATVASGRVRELLGEHHPITREVALGHAAIVALAVDPVAGVAALRRLADEVGPGEGGAIERGMIELELGEVLLTLGAPDQAIAPLAEAVELLDTLSPNSAHGRRAAMFLARAQDLVGDR